MLTATAKMLHLYLTVLRRPAAVAFRTDTIEGEARTKITNSPPGKCPVCHMANPAMPTSHKVTLKRYAFVS